MIANTDTHTESRFAELCKLDPKLTELAAEATRARANPGAPFCANSVWFGYDGYRGIKRRLVQLVGWMRHDEKPELKTIDAYNVAYDAIYGLLPECEGGCSCLPVPPVLAGYEEGDTK